jgi:hypothetical protein
MKGEFHHRENADGTIDSICLHCYLTAASAENMADLHAREAAHQCPDREIIKENVQRIRRGDTCDVSRMDESPFTPSGSGTLA